jgi:hypothetical protein
MRKSTAVLALLLTSCGGGESEETIAKDRAAAAANWAVIVKVDGADVKLPLEAMNVLLYKDEEMAKANPTVFEIEGKDISLFGEIPPAANPDYAEKWEKLIGVTLTIKTSGEFHRDVVESKLTLPGKPPVAVTGGTMTTESISGKWSGSTGDKTLKGRITLTLQDGRTLQGTFAVHAITWG